MSDILFFSCSITALCALFLLSALFSGTETVMFSLSPVQLQRIGRRSPSLKTKIERLLLNPSSVLALLLVGNTFVNFCVAGLGYVILERAIPRYAEIVSVPLMTVLLLLFGEVIPKRIAMTCTEHLAVVGYWVVKTFRWPFYPFVMAMGASTRLFRKALRRERRQLNDDELLTIVRMSEKQGVLDREEVSMVDGIMRLAELKVSDEMIPRVDMAAIDLDEPAAGYLPLARSAKHRFLPVYRKTPDQIEGFLDVVPFLLDPEHRISTAIRKPIFVPENLSLDKLLVSFQTHGNTIVCVLDEYGGTAGIITLNDVLEVVTDPVLSGGETEDDDIKPLGKDVWRLDGKVGIERINHELNLSLSADDSDRISGWITFHAECIPYPGLEVHAQGCKVTVLSMRRRGITAVRLEVVNRRSTDPEEELKEMLEEEDNDLRASSPEEDGGES